MTDPLEVLWLNDPEPPKVAELVCTKCGFRRQSAIDRMGRTVEVDKVVLVASTCPHCGWKHSTVDDFTEGVLVVSDEDSV